MVSKVPHDPNEVIALVNDKDEVIGSEKRGIVHEKGLKHREVCAFIINSKKEVLFQQRVGSGNWDDSCSGHFPTEQSYIEAVQRECEEELGLALGETDFEFIKKDYFESGGKINKINNRFYNLYIVRKDIPLDQINFDKGEIMSVKYFNKSEVQKILEKGNLTLTTAYNLEKYILKLL